MFTAEIIQNRLRGRPFHPVRIITSEGMRFDVFHPDLVLVGRHDLIIGTPDPVNLTIYSDLVTRVALVHVVALEDLPSSSQSLANGPAA